MEIFLFILHLLGMELTPVALMAIIYILFNKVKFFKNLNYWWKQLLVGVLFAGLVIISYTFSIPITIDNSTAYVSNGTVFPVLLCLVFGWPSGFIAALAGALYRGLAFNDTLKLSIVISLIFSFVIGTLTRLLLYKNKRTKWYNAALTGVFVETINFLLFFIFAKDTTDAYHILSIIDFICIVGAALTCSAAILLLNLIDRKLLKIDNLSSKSSAHSISTRIQHRLFIATTFTLIVVSTSTYFVQYKRSVNNISDELRLASTYVSTNFEYTFSINLYKEHLNEISKEDPKPTINYQSYNEICAKEKIKKHGFFYIIFNDYIEYDLQDPALSKKLELADNEHPKIPNVGGGGYKEGCVISTLYNEDDKDKKINVPFTFDDKRSVFELNKNEKSYKNNDGSYSMNIINVHIKGVKYYASVFEESVYGPLGSNRVCRYYVVSLANSNEYDANVGISLKIAIYTEILAFLFLFAAVNFLLRKIVINKIYQVNSSLEKITNGDLNEVVSAKGSKEIERLSNRINMTVDSLKLYARKMEQKMEEDLLLAKKIQTTSVPTLFPLVKHYEIYATMHTAKEVGGDFYDYVTIDDSHVLFLVADVSGKGIPAALFMMRAKTLIKSLVSTGIPLEYVVKRANDELCSENTAGLFVTMWIGILDTKTGKVTYVNCGHCMPIARIAGEYSYIKQRHNFVLGAVEGFNFKSDSITLGLDDMLLLYTDGVTEATNRNFELYGEKRLLKFISNSMSVFDCHQLLERINEEIDRYQKDVEQADDITLLALKYRGNANDSESREITLRVKTEETITVVNFVKTFMYKNRADEDKIKEMTNAVDEVFTNIVKYAYPRRIGYVKVKVEVKDRLITIRFIDKGVPFDPTKGVGKNNKEGLGLLIIKKCVDKMTYNRENNENILLLEKNI